MSQVGEVHTYESLFHMNERTFTHLIWYTLPSILQKNAFTNSPPIETASRSNQFHEISVTNHK